MTATTSTRVAVTPRPPYYAAITTTELMQEYDAEEHRVRGLELLKLARQMPDFLGLEVFFDGNASVALSYWKTLDAIDEWRRHPIHMAAKNKAKAGWFGPCITRIAKIESDYGFNLR